MNEENDEKHLPSLPENDIKPVEKVYVKIEPQNISGENCEIKLLEQGKKEEEGFNVLNFIYAHGNLEDGYDIVIGNKYMIDQFELFGADITMKRHIIGINYNSPNNKDVKVDLYMWKADYGSALVIKGLLVDPTDDEDVTYAEACMDEMRVQI